jgi:TonB family protein
MLRTIPGVQISANPTGSSISMRGARCQPLVWVDGAPALSGPLDVDIFAPFTLDGIEVYKGVSEVPVELRGPRGEERCGVIALWSRMPDRQPKKSKRKPVTAEELNRLIASATVYTADQVDRPARADSSVMLEPIYPDSLKQAHTSGSAIVEFVVDTEGRVEPETISVVVASHPAFARAARDAAPSARFIPAFHQGHAVRQVVQLPVEFQATGIARGRKDQQ